MSIARVDPVTTPALGANIAGRRRQDPGGDLRESPGRLVAAGAWAACMAAGAGLAVVTMLVLVGWIAAPHFGFGLIGVLRTAAVFWLVGHHVTVQVAGAGRIGMLPLGLVALPGTLLWRAGRSIVRCHHVGGLREVFAPALAIAVPYSALAAGLAFASRSALAAASMPQALVASFMIAFVAAGFGAARALAPWDRLSALLSARTRSVLAGSAGSLAVLFAAGAMTTAFALTADLHRFAAAYRLLDPGAVGAVLLLLTQVAYLPNAALWAVAYMLGPGFAVGAGTVAAPSGSVLGPVPAFPLLAALPAGTHGSGPGWLGVLLLAVPYLAGAVGGLLLVRMGPTPTLESAPMRGFCCGVLTGVVLGVGAAFAGGPLGSGRMAVVGPSAWQVAAVASLETGICAAITAGAVNWWYLRSRRVREPGPRAADPRVARGGRRHTRAAGGLVDPVRWPGHVAGDDDTHVIYLDRWEGDQDEPPADRRAGGPSALP